MLEILNIVPFSNLMHPVNGKSEELQDIYQGQEDSDGEDFENSEEESGNDESSGIDLTPHDSEEGSRRSQDVTAIEIEVAIVSALSKCPNQSCTVTSIAGRVLKEFEILTRGKPRKTFERRVIIACDSLEKKGVLEKYKATNQRIRLIKY